jgi:ketosteroid isomerase-like protein
MTATSATRTETNREIIRQAFDAWCQGTGAITDVFAPGMVWRIEGHSAASKEYRSKQQFIDEVLAPFGARFTVSEPFLPSHDPRGLRRRRHRRRYLGRPRDRQRRPAL